MSLLFILISLLTLTNSITPSPTEDSQELPSTSLPSQDSPSSLEESSGEVSLPPMEELQDGFLIPLYGNSDGGAKEMEVAHEQLLELQRTPSTSTQQRQKTSCKSPVSTSPRSATSSNTVSATASFGASMSSTSSLPLTATSSNTSPPSSP